MIQIVTQSHFQIDRGAQAQQKLRELLHDHNAKRLIDPILNHIPIDAVMSLQSGPFNVDHVIIKAMLDQQILSFDIDQFSHVSPLNDYDHPVTVIGYDHIAKTQTIVIAKTIDQGLTEAIMTMQN